MTTSTDPIAPRARRLRPSSTLRLMTSAGAVIAAALLAMPAVSADRLPDKDVKGLLERIDNERDRFEDQLDAARIREGAASSGRILSPAAQTTWGTVESGLQKVALAFGLPARLP